MRKQVLIACSMMENEIKAAAAELKSTIPVVWMQRALHDSPSDMSVILQEQIDSLSEYDDILLAYGLCGNGTAALSSRSSRLIIPRFDDCINILLCKEPRTQRALTRPGCLYLTEGWIQDELSIVRQCQKLQCEYPDEMYDTIINSIYGGYHSLCVIDTGCYDTAGVLEYADTAASLIDAQVHSVSGSNRILKKLLSGDWDENFIILEPGECAGHNRFIL